MTIEGNKNIFPIDISRAGALTCESCGEEFICEANKEKCWCSYVEVSTENLTAMRENFNNCLCRKCLENMKAEKMEPEKM